MALDDIYNRRTFTNFGPSLSRFSKHIPEALASPLLCLAGVLLSQPAWGTILHTWAADDPQRFAAIIVRNWEIPPEFGLCNADLSQGKTLDTASCRTAAFMLQFFAKDLNFVSIPAGDLPAVRAVLDEIQTLQRKDQK